MKLYNDIIQGSDEWLNLKAGKFTGSDFHIFFGNSDTKKAQLAKKATERITGIPEPSKYNNAIMQRGVDLEPFAREAYEKHTFTTVNEIGFVERDKTCGCSPDGLVGEKGMTEFKCPIGTTYLNLITNPIKIIPMYNTQMQFNLNICERDWCDFVVFHPDFKDNTLIIKRVYRDEELIQKINNTLIECNLEIDNIINKYINYK